MDNSSKLTGELLYIVPEERAINYLWENNARKIPKNVQIVSIEDAIENKECFFDKSNIELNTIWVKHPYKQKYIDLIQSEENIIQSKLDAFGIIVKHLGVKEFETTYATEVISEREISVNGEIGYKVLNTNAEVKITNNDTKTAKYYRHEKFSGNFTEDSYLKAIEQAKLFGLNDDRDIAYLLEVRNPTDNNLLTSRYVTFELTEEINKKIDIAFSLSGLNLFKISSKYNETLKTKKTITIKSNLIF